MRKNRLHTASIIVGSILAFAIAFSHFFASACNSSVEKTKTEQTENRGGDQAESYISLPTFSLPAPIHVEGGLGAHCLLEIFFEKDSDADHVEEDLFLVNRLFETMFTVIVSPNAP